MDILEDHSSHDGSPEPIEIPVEGSDARALIVQKIQQEVTHRGLREFVRTDIPKLPLSELGTILAFLESGEYDGLQTHIWDYATIRRRQESLKARESF